MSGLIERLNQELEEFGRRAQAAFDEGKAQLERFRLRRERDEVARDFGYLAHRRERGHPVEPGQVDGFLARLDALDASIAKVEREIAEAKGEKVSVSEEPAPASAQTTEAEVQAS